MRGKIILFFLALSGALSLRAEIIVDNSAEATAGYSVPIGTNNDASGCLAAQEFTLPDTLNPYLLNQISLWLNPTNGGGSVSVNLWNVGADGNPTNEITFVASQIVTNIGEVDFVPTNAIYLSPGFSYYVVVSPTTAADNNLVSLAFTTSQNWDGSGELDNFASTQAGFWQNFPVSNGPYQISVQADSVSPTLAISRSGNVTTLNWPAAAIGFVPETATNLASPVWLAVTNQPVSSANAASVTNVTSDPARFFRLRQSLMVDNLMEPFAGLYGPISTNASGFLIAQEFALPAGSNSYHLDKVTLPLSSDGGENGTISVSVWNVAADGSPTNEIATVASQLVGQTANVDFVPTNFITLAAGTSYYIVTAPQSVADNGLIYWAYTQSTNAIGLGALGSSADTSAGSVWSVYPIDAGLYPQQMSVQASPVSP